MILLESLKTDLGGAAPSFSLPGTDGKTYSLDDFADSKALIIVFMCNHCPYVHAVIDRLIAIQNDYADRGVQVVGINSNDSSTHPDDSFENMIKFVSERGVNFPYLYDESQKVAEDFGAQCTPDIFVYDQDHALAYHGRIDDSWQDEAAVTKRELCEALDMILAGEKPSSDQNPSMGCSIKWKN
jgi:peroxiredoxin